MALETLLIVVFGLVGGTCGAMAPAGPVSVLVIKRALDGDYRKALGTGLGRIPAEALYCALATFGVVALIQKFPAATLTIEILGTLVFAAVGIFLLVQRPKPADDAVDEIVDEAVGEVAGGTGGTSSARDGFVAGLLIAFFNPTLLLSWSAVIAIGLSMTGFQPNLVQKITLPVSHGIGIGLGYTILVSVLRRFGPRLDHRYVRRVMQLVGLGFVSFAIYTALGLFGLI